METEEISKLLTKTGTLTLGIVCKEGIVLAADRRVSFGSASGGVSYLAGQLNKIIKINDRIIATMAGTASDANRVLELLRAEFRLKELKTREKISVPEAAGFLSNVVYHNIRTPSMIPNIAHFLLSGYDDNGVYLYDISPDGLLKKEEGYAASGAGIMQAHPILDSEFKPGISLKEGVELAKKCIKASMKRDPSVGQGIDVYTIKKNDISHVVSEEVVPQYK